MEYKSKIILLITILLAGQAQARDASGCLNIQDNSARLACYDRELGFRSAAPERPQVLQQTRQSRPVVDSKLSASSASSSPVLARAQEAYDQVVADSITMLVTKVNKTKRQGTYFSTNTNRTFKRVTDRSIAFKVNDRIELQPGVLGSIFLVNQAGLRIKVKEIK
jgi:hypothetical protein